MQTEVAGAGRVFGRRAEPMPPAALAPAACFDWRAVLDELEGAYAPNTLKAYRSDFAIFEAWCARAGERCLPATAQTLARFVAADAVSAAPASLKRRLYAVRKVHRLLGLPNAVGEEPVTIAMRRALRSKLRRPVQALGLNATLREQMIAACPDSLMGKRDAAMLALGYDTLCRRGELVALQVEDLHAVPGGGARVMVRRSKSDPFGDGRWAHLSARGLARVRAWLEAAGIREGVIFRGLRSGKLSPVGMDPIAVNRLVKAAGARAGLSEEVVGKALREWGQPVIVATKCGVLPNDDKTPRRFASREIILEEVEGFTGENT